MKRLWQFLTPFLIVAAVVAFIAWLIKTDTPPETRAWEAYSDGEMKP